MSNILVVAPHPDDETLGCGGAILRHVAQGDSVHWCIVTAMTSAAGYAADRIAARAATIETVAKHYNLQTFTNLGFRQPNWINCPVQRWLPGFRTLFQRSHPNEFTCRTPPTHTAIIGFLLKLRRRAPNGSDTTPSSRCSPTKPCQKPALASTRAWMRSVPIITSIFRTIWLERSRPQASMGMNLRPPPVSAKRGWCPRAGGVARR